MKSPINLLRFALAAFAFFACFAGNLRAAALDLTLPSPLNASAYSPGATAVKTIRVLSIDYQTGVVRFQLLDAAGAAYGGGAVFGLTDPTLNESNAQAKITAAITP